MSGCVVLLLITLLGQRHVALYKRKAQQIALAAGVFDGEGRIMVTSEGLLPNRRITKTYLERVRSINSTKAMYLTAESLLMMCFASRIRFSSGSFGLHFTGKV